MSPKQCPGVNAKPFNEAVDKVTPRLTNAFSMEERTEEAKIFDMRPMDGRDELVKILKTMVNPDVCLTDLQEDRLFIDMWEYLKNPEQIKLLAMVAAINSYRNECTNCLTVICKKRDSKHPLQ